MEHSLGRAYSAPGLHQVAEGSAQGNTLHVRLQLQRDNNAVGRAGKQSSFIYDWFIYYFCCIRRGYVRNHALMALLGFNSGACYVFVIYLLLFLIEVGDRRART